MAHREGKASAAESADDVWRSPPGDGAATPRARSHRRVALLLIPVVVILAGACVDVGMALSNPPASRYAGISPAFAAQTGWKRIYAAGLSPTRERAWRNDDLPVPVAVAVSAKSYPSTLLAIIEAKRQAGARPGGGEWVTGDRFTSTQLEAASRGARNVAGWETSCDAASDACGAYKFTFRYANSVLTVSIVSIPREPPMTTAMALQYVGDVTKLEPHGKSD